MSTEILKQVAYSLEENCIAAILGVVYDGRHLLCSRIGFDCMQRPGQRDRSSGQRDGITNPELSFHTIPVPLTILLFNILIPLECLDKFSMHQCDLRPLACQ